MNQMNNQSKINRTTSENQIENPIETVEMKVIQLKADRRISSNPTFQAHLLGLLGKTGFHAPLLHFAAF